MKNLAALIQFGSTARGRGALTLGVALCLLGLVLSASAKQGTFTTFNAPGAGTAVNQGTVPTSIDPSGTVVGYYANGNPTVYHGFVRDPKGNITTIDIGNSNDTGAIGINPSGTVTGDYNVEPNVSDLYHGFVRYPNGTITTFDAPGAGAGPNEGTFPFSINPSGTVTGYYWDGDDLAHGFVRYPDGTFTTFDAPDAGTVGYPDHSFMEGTLGASISPSGTITGFYLDGTGKFVGHGFVRNSKGNIAEFNVSGAGSGQNEGTFPQAINPSGTVTGFYVDADGVDHGFVGRP